MQLKPSVSGTCNPNLVMMVEDNRDIRDTLVSALEIHGFDVVAAAHGLAALDVLHASSALPAVILIDVLMPVMDGRGLVRALKSAPELAGIPLVILSGAVGISSLAASLGASAHIQKPVSIVRLVEVVRLFCPLPRSAGGTDISSNSAVGLR